MSDDGMNGEGFYYSSGIATASSMISSTYQDDPNFPKIDIVRNSSKMKRILRGDNPKSKHTRKRNFRRQR